MPAKPIAITLDEEEIKAGTSTQAVWSTVPVPADYEWVLKDVEDYPPKDGKKGGWKLIMGLAQKPSMTRQIWLSFSKAARWKFVQVWQAFGYEFEPGERTRVNPNDHIGQIVGGRLDWDDDEAYKEIKFLFALAEAPEESDEGDELEVLGDEGDVEGEDLSADDGDDEEVEPIEQLAESDDGIEDIEEDTE